MDAASVRDELRAFVARALMRNPSYALRDDEPIISGGLIDSFALAELAVFIEERWRVTIPDSDLIAENMDTLDRIVALVLAAE